MNRLYFVRHGENKANLTKELSCRQIDYPLTSKGLLQAQQTAARFKDTPIDVIASSPLRRARQTAEIIALEHQKDILVLENFREIDVGILELQPPSAENWRRYKETIDAWFAGRHEVGFPGGESYISLWNRLHEGVALLAGDEDGRNIIVVGHGGALGVALKDLCPEIDSEWLRSSQSHNCSVTEIHLSWRDGRLQGDLIGWAAHDHLHGLAAELVSGVPEGWLEGKV